MITELGSGHTNDFQPTKSKLSAGAEELAKKAAKEISENYASKHVPDSSKEHCPTCEAYSFRIIQSALTAHAAAATKQKRKSEFNRADRSPGTQSLAPFMTFHLLTKKVAEQVRDCYLDVKPFSMEQLQSILDSFASEIQNNTLLQLSVERTADGIASSVEKIATERLFTAYKTEVAALARAAKAEAACGEMQGWFGREIERIKTVLPNTVGHELRELYEIYIEQIRHFLSIDCGAQLLAELERLRQNVFMLQNLIREYKAAGKLGWQDEAHKKKVLDKWNVADKQNLGADGLLASLLAELSQLRWIDYSVQKPTKEDADKWGKVQFLWSDNDSITASWDMDMRYGNTRATHWRRNPKPEASAPPATSEKAESGFFGVPPANPKPESVEESTPSTVAFQATGEIVGIVDTSGDEPIGGKIARVIQRVIDGQFDETPTILSKTVVCPKCEYMFSTSALTPSPPSSKHIGK